MMRFAKLTSFVLLSAGLSFAQTSAADRTSLSPHTTLPVSFTRTVSADHAKAGDLVEAKTMQPVFLSNGQEIPQGAQVLGRVVKANPFVYDKTPYAKQPQGELTIEFDTLVTRGEKIPLHVSLRAIADYFATDAAYRPRPSDEDSLASTTQVGGDIVTPSQKEIVSPGGDTVGYNKQGGRFAHLLANVGAGNMRCDESNTEQSMAIFSASACGAYGFTNMVLNVNGYGSEARTFSFVSTRRSPEIARYSSALLEVTPNTSLMSSTRQ